ncbi:MAG: hypothetical protein ACP5GJ_03800 [Nanopusillaceae archaeon]|jgi:hypothetical protein
MIVRSNNKYFYIQNKVARDILNRLSNKKYYDISILQDLTQKYSRKKIYDTLRLLHKHGIIEIKKTYIGRIYFKNKSKRTRIFDISISIATISSTLIYILAQQIIGYSHILSVYGFLIGILSSINILLLLLIRRIYDISIRI